MADESGLQGVTSQQEAADAQPAAPESAQVEPKYVTAEDLGRFKEEVLTEAGKKAQSFTDKLANRVNEKMKQIEESARYTGQELTPEQKAKIRQDVTAEVYSTPEPSPPETSGKAAPAQAQQQGAQGIDPIAAAAIKMAEKVGGFTEADPEYKEIVRNASLSPDEWLVKVADAVQAKKERTAKQADRNPASTIVGAGLNAGSPIEIPSSAKSAWNDVEYKR